ncbi:MAG: OmpA family protein, partial [Proteobacteria bacterium]|nr:OmpA family protein [Pseudomonadota bacterium]
MMRAFFLLPTLLLPTLASANELQVGLAGGVMMTDQLEMIGSGPYVTPRVTWWYNDTLGFEGEIGVFTGKTRIGDFSHVTLTPKIGVVGNLAPKQLLEPMIVAGLGGFFKNTNCGSGVDCHDRDVLGAEYVTPDADFLVNGGPAVQFRIGETPLSLRTDYRFVVNLGTESYRNRGTAFMDWEWTFNVNWRFGQMKDKDKDTVDDAVDQCLEEMEDLDSFEDEDGCPDNDNDNDSIVDADDTCPNEAEDVDKFEDEDGCPDNDNDNDDIADSDDECPDEAGPEKTDGCADPDNDGVGSPYDDCPEEEGPAELGGCPDTDEDGVADVDDKCPEEVGLPKAQGCPDRDEDGVADMKDECPDKAIDEKANPRRSNGCPARVFLGKKQLFITEDVNFTSGTAKISSRSNGLLNDIAESLITFKGVKKLQIEGHTDSDGDDDANMALSQARAEAVMAYLVKKGVSEKRLVAKGFGETKPIGDNETKDGKAQNRRVELNILEQDTPKKRAIKRKGKKDKPEETGAEGTEA